jgi:hypothetical protein
METKNQNRGQDDREKRDQRQQNQNQSSDNRVDENLNPQGDRNAEEGSSNFDKRRDVTAQKNQSQNQYRLGGLAKGEEDREDQENNRMNENAGGRGHQKREDSHQPRSRRLNEEDEDADSEQAANREGSGKHEHPGDKNAKLNQ